ncbi:armadillo-type protein, partial [Dimargaris cristalligena]
ASAPEQLSISLPLIIPRLVEVLADSHHRVQESAEGAFDSFGKVISNPEILELVPRLLRGLINPNTATQPALAGLLNTAFVHYIDAPSLALIVPILQRGLRERSTVTKRQSAQIIGSMVSLADHNDLVPYIPTLVPQLRNVLADPVPETRSTSSKALGLLVENLGETYFSDLVEELMRTLSEPVSNMERSGAAQGLSEILAGLGIDRMTALLPEIVANTTHAKVNVREGYMSLLIYLPLTFGTRFQTYLPDILTPIVRGLADESEYVRDASLRAGQIVIHNFVKEAISLMLPQLEEGMFDANWRIRNSSVELIGDLLFKITGLDGNHTEKALGNVPDPDDEDSDMEQLEENTNAETNNPQNAPGNKKKALKAQRRQQSKNDKAKGGEGDDDDEDDEEEIEHVSAEDCRRRLVEALGQERRDTVLASLYVARADPVAVVRQTTTSIWKSIASNTPRTVKDILPQIMNIIMTSLANENEERRRIAARTLGELVRKLGEAVLHRVLPILSAGLEPTNPENVRQGACVGLGEVISTTGRNHAEDYAEIVIPALRTALCDEAPTVREAAATAFDLLQQCLGPQAVDEIVPHLLNALNEPATSARALEALREITGVRAQAVFPTLVPKLIAQPISAFNARALATLVTVAGASLTRRLNTILSALLTSLMRETDQATLEALRDAIASLVGSIDDEDGLHSLMMLLFEHVRDDQPVTTRTESFWVLSTLCANADDVDLSDYAVDWIRTLLGLFKDDEHPELLKAAWTALDALLKTFSKEDTEDFVLPTLAALQSLSDNVDGCPIAGFNLPKGIAPLLPPLTQGLMFGSTETREAASISIGLLVKHTTAANLRPYVTQITGPLIRIVGDRHPPEVKAAILATLGELLEKVPTFLRPFFPQLQRTFVKSLSESTYDVRRLAVAALTTLVAHHTRFDPLIVELCAGTKLGESSVKVTMIQALAKVLGSAQSPISDASREAAAQSDASSDVRAAAIDCLEKI